MRRLMSRAVSLLATRKLFRSIFRIPDVPHAVHLYIRKWHFVQNFSLFYGLCSRKNPASLLTPLVTIKLFPSTVGVAGNGTHVPPATLAEYSNPKPPAFVGHESTRLFPCRVPVKLGTEACPTKVTTLNGGNWYVNIEFEI